MPAPAVFPTTAQQVCSRCRKRKIRCDLKLPACKNCKLADIECTFWDASIREEIPCAYLYSLQQKVAALQNEIQQATDQGQASARAIPNNLKSVFESSQSCHVEVADRDDLPSSTRITYLGPQSSFQLTQRFLSDAVSYHMSNNTLIPPQLLSNAQSNFQEFDSSATAPSFPIINDLRKVELHNLVPPSTQRAIIDHYLKVVVPQYTLFSIEEASPLFVHENALKWYSSNKTDPAAYTLIIVFAISTALVTRDLDSNLANMSLQSREEVYKLSLGNAAHEAPETIRMCAALCALALCEIVSPTTGQFWDILGRAISVMQDIQQDYLLRHSELDVNLRHLEGTLLKLESLAMAHFGRPSLFFDTQIQICLADQAESSARLEELDIAKHISIITRALTSVPPPTEASLEGLIPESHQVPRHDSNISLSSAMLYLAMHPLLTNLELFASDGHWELPSLRMVGVIARSASAVIDHLTQLNQNKMIVSIWLASEQVMKAGIVWVSSVIHQRRLSRTRPQEAIRQEISIAFRPIAKVSSLLASFAARWKPGAAYIDVWETVVELMWASM